VATYSHREWARKVNPRNEKSAVPHLKVVGILAYRRESTRNLPNTGDTVFYLGHVGCTEGGRTYAEGERDSREKRPHNYRRETPILRTSHKTGGKAHLLRGCAIN